MADAGRDSDVPALEELSEIHLEDDDGNPEGAGAVVPVVDKVYHIPGELNIADKLTRGTVDWIEEQMGKDSEWQQGPDFLKLPRPEWPLSRNFVPEVPESRSKYLKMMSINTNPMEKLVRRLYKVKEVMAKHSSYDRAKDIIARASAAASLSNFTQEKILKPTVLDYQNAKYLMDLASMDDVFEMMKNSKDHHLKRNKRTHSLQSLVKSNSLASRPFLK